MARRTARPEPLRPDTRDRMVAGAADLLRRRGVAGTSLRDVVAHTGTPRGSLGHHFPQGKPQLLVEAVEYARSQVSGPLDAALTRLGAVDGLRAFADRWRHALHASAYEAGCPVMAIAVESPSDAAGPGLDARACAHGAFEEWTGLLAVALQRDGVAPSRAQSLATLAVASFEGAIGLCRAARSGDPLDRVASELRRAFEEALQDSSTKR